MTLALEMLAERRILDAIEAGELDDLPGAGSPLRCDDDALVPEALRAAYRVLANAGVVPEEVALRRSIVELAERLDDMGDAEERRGARCRLALLKLKLESCGGRGAHRAPRRAITARSARRGGG